MQLPISDQ